MQGLERLKDLIKGQNDRPLNKVVDYLLTRSDMNDKYLNEEKDLKGMISYIRSEAQNQAVNGVAMIEDEVVYGWAVHYFDESNEKLGMNKPAIETKKDNIEKVSVKESKKEQEEIGQLSLF